MKGKKAGIREQAGNTARKMLAKGMEINEIAELTGLDMNDVEKLNPLSEPGLQ